MSPDETQLLQLLITRSFKFNRGGFRLASGDKSDYYIDGKMTQVYSEGAARIGEILYQRTKDLEIDALGGLEVGAVPLTTAAVITYHLHGRRLEGFWVRDKEKWDFVLVQQPIERIFHGLAGRGLALACLTQSNRLRRFDLSRLDK